MLNKILISQKDRHFSKSEKYASIKKGCQLRHPLRIAAINCTPHSCIPIWIVNRLTQLAHRIYKYNMFQAKGQDISISETFNNILRLYYNKRETFNSSK